MPGGGMARVFLAEDTALARKVVIKVLSPDLAEGLSQERFRRETHLAAQLQHPHLVPVLHAGNADGLPWFAMPYVAGESLRIRLKSGDAIPPREAVAILRDVARAMAYAHAEGVVHRDIKPDNVLISGGAAMVSDFGIAKALSSSKSSGEHDAILTRAGNSLGTPAYMAPEQVAADPAADHRVDIYAFGILAYELLSGRTPFSHMSPQTLLTAHLVEKPADLASHGVALPPSLVALVMQCLEKDPARRPASAEELVQRLDELDWSGEHQRAATRTPSARERMIGAVVAVAMAIAAGAWWWSTRTPPLTSNPQLVAVVPFRIASADPALHYLREGMLDLLAGKLPGQGGLQATEPRQLLEAWRSAGGSASADLATRDAHRLARNLGSGWLLLGDVVGSPSRITLNAALFPVDGTTPKTRVSLEGPPDSLGGLVDQMVEQLLASVSGEAGTTAALSGTSLPVLRAYLDAVQKFRAGMPTAVPAFTAVLDLDSTFAPAALGLMQATGWWNDGGASARAQRLAWAGREQLNARDRALLAATLGPAYPERPSARQELEAAERYLQLAPDRADAWHLVGDKIYHFGHALGMPDRATRSAEYFRRAVAIDSTYVPGYIHLQQLAVELGDTALDQRLERLRLRVDTGSYWTKPQHWYRAYMRGDTAAARAILRDTKGDNSVLWFIQRASINAPGIDPADAMGALDTLLADANTPANRRSVLRTIAAQAMASGQPAAAQQRLLEGYDATEEALLVRLVYDAIFGHGDSVAARAAAERLAPLALSRPAAPGDSLLRSRQQAAARAVLYWRLDHRDTAGYTRMMAQLPHPAPGAGAVPLDAVTVASLEAMRADVTGDPSAPVLADRLDSLMAATTYQESAIRLGLSAPVTRALLEKHRGPERALAAVRRRASWWNNDAPYLGTQLREEGRLAVLAGRPEEAQAAWRHYLDLRRRPEVALEPEVAQVRADLARITQR